MTETNAAEDDEVYEAEQEKKDLDAQSDESRIAKAADHIKNIVMGNSGEDK